MLNVAHIYMIESADRTKRYIGSTKDFNRRMIEHKHDCKVYLGGSSRKYCSSFEIMKDPGHFSNIIETHTNISRAKLRQREAELIKQYNCVNSNVPGRTIQASKQAYYQSNVTTINNKINCFCGGRYTHQHKSKHFKTHLHQAAEIKKIKSELEQIKKSNDIILKFVKKILAKKENTINKNFNTCSITNQTINQ